MYQGAGVALANINTEWCNGNTSPFGGEFLGSSPSSVANLDYAHKPKLPYLR